MTDVNSVGSVAALTTMGRARAYLGRVAARDVAQVLLRHDVTRLVDDRTGALTSYMARAWTAAREGGIVSD